MAVSLADGLTELAEVFDPQVVAEYGITEEDLDRVVRYLRLLLGVGQCRRSRFPSAC